MTDYNKIISEGPSFRRSFAWRFLALFARQFYDQERTLDEIHTYFDPATTPAGFLDYLASWVALDLDHNWPEARQRELISRAVELYKTRGLPDGIATFVEIYTGYRPRIIEHHKAGMKIGVRSQVGVNTKIYRASRDEVFRFTVSLKVPDPEAIDVNQVKRIIDIQKPSWSRYYLTLDSTFMQLGVNSTIGVDTILGE